MSIIKKSFQSSSSFDEFLHRYIDFYTESVKSLKAQNFSPLLDLIFECQKNQKKIILLGNGGSAANATHISTGLSYITREWEFPLKSISLAADPILLTSLGNDFSFEDVFLKQMQVHLDKGDVVIALSVSGRSANVIKAVRFAKEKGNKIVGLTGSNGGDLKDLSDFCIHIPSEDTLFGVTEDVHMVFGHALTYYLEYLFQANRK